MLHSSTQKQNEPRMGKPPLSTLSTCPYLQVGVGPMLHMDGPYLLLVQKFVSSRGPASRSDPWDPRQREHASRSPPDRRLGKYDRISTEIRSYRRIVVFVSYFRIVFVSVVFALCDGRRPAALTHIQRLLSCVAVCPAVLRKTLLRPS